jgi:hypothetical protein
VGLSRREALLLPGEQSTAFREAAIHAAVEAMALPVPAVWGVLEVGGRGVSYSTV